MRLFVRRIVMEPQKGRGDIQFVIFEEGKFSTPLAIVSQHDAEHLREELLNQMNDEEES